MGTIVNNPLRSITDADQITSASAARPGPAPIAALLGLFVITLDAMVVNVALLAQPATFLRGMHTNLLIAAGVALATAVASQALRSARQRAR